MSTIATPEDVTRRWLGTDPLPSDEVIQAWLDDSETLVLSEFPDVLARIENDDDDGVLHRNLVFVEVQLTTQALKNPDGVRQRAQTAGSYTDSVTYGVETIQQAMQLTPVHRAMLAGKTARHSGLDMTATPRLMNPLQGAWVNGPTGMEPGPC